MSSSLTSSTALINRVIATLQIEADGILGLIHTLDNGSVLKAVDLMVNTTGRIVVSGIGKSGHIGRKIAATLASTGTPAFFMHPTEAAHGDLGMVLPCDVVLLLSNSGTTEELITLLPSFKRHQIPIIAMTGHSESLLAQAATVHLNVGVQYEACPLDLAPTASTTAALAMGDALAMAVLSAKGFTTHDFARSHPGGALGRKLLTHVRDVMRSDSALPWVTMESLVPHALMQMTQKGIGMTAVVHSHQNNLLLKGIFTDGDLRRAIERYGDIRHLKVNECMTSTPLTINEDAMAIEAVQLMDIHRKNQLLVLNQEGYLVGAVHTHDLMKAKII